MTRTRLALLSAVLASLAGLAQAADGEIKKIDAANAKVTIKHGTLANLDMPPMTMAFKAVPESLLKGLAVGDQVSFEADKRDGVYVVTAIAKR